MKPLISQVTPRLCLRQGSPFEKGLHQCMPAYRRKPDAGIRCDMIIELGSQRLMRAEQDPLILVVEAVEETRDGIEKLLKTDGYRIEPARGEEDAVARAMRQAPDLILVSPGAWRMALATA